MKKIGLVIVNYNDALNTINLINNVSNFKVINKIVVVDNKSTDNSLELLKQIESKKVDIISNLENKGYSSAINIGSKYLIDNYKDCYILVSNSDIDIPNEDTIKEIVNTFKEDDIAIVMPKIYENNNIKRGWKLNDPLKDLLISIPFINRIYRNKILNYNDSYYNSKTTYIDVFYGCFFAIDSKVLEEVNFFDENTFLYYEENIMARKIQSIKKKICINNSIYVIHKHNATIGNNISLLNKYKIYKKSFWYYEKEYNNAKPWQMALFKVLYYVGLIPYKIKLLFTKKIKVCKNLLI